MRVFDPPPPAGERPATFPSPFARAPHALARRAADELMRELRAGELRDAALDAPGGGKMFGVLVCARGDGTIGYLRAFSGMLAGSWQRAGWAPPVFDEAARDAWWPAAEAELARLAARWAAIAEGDELRRARGALGDVEARHARERGELHARHAANRAARAAARARLGGGDDDDVDAGVDAGDAHTARLHLLAQASRADTAELRRLRARHAEELAAATARVAELDAAAAALAAERAAHSRDYLARIHADYALRSVRGETRALRELFAPATPPGGAGDCAAPKLLVHAARLGLAPLALAEFWWGAPPPTGGRIAGAFYPACRGKCGPILPFLLAGVPLADTPQFGGGPIAAAEPRELYADAHVIVVGKPCGLLSVPGRSGALRDSVLTRLRARYGPATTVVHRLDLDTSGVLLAARDAATHAALQARFARHEIGKRYIALLAHPLAEGAPRAGTIELALRVDLDDRPRQIVDAAHGKPALTRYRMLDATRVELAPLTGRTHQLRVHCAHARGLGTPILGDALYGEPAERLYLHADSLAFAHPNTGAPIEITWPAPF